MTVYIVEMLRYGDREAHSYISGVYSDRDIAEDEAKLHILARAGKYTAEIHEETVDDVRGGSVVCRIDDVYEDEENIENDIKSRKDRLKYIEQKRDAK